MSPTDEKEAKKEGLSRREVAKLTGMSLSTIIRLQKAGKLPQVQLGGFRCRVVIPRRALDELFDSPNGSATVADAQGGEAPPTPAKKKPGPKPGWMKP